MKGPIVSIIIPAYNAAAYLKEAIDSARRQTYPNIEIIIVDDGSTDSTASLLDTLRREDERLQIITQKNKGLAGARNAGIAQAKGAFISFLDADDQYLPNKIALQIAIEEREGVDVVLGNSFYFYETKPAEKYCFRNQNSGLTRSELKKGNSININTALLKKSSFAEPWFDESLRTSEDWDFWLRAVSNGKKFFIHPDFIVTTQLRHTSLQSNLALQKKNDVYVLMKNFGKIPLWARIKFWVAAIIMRLPIFLRKIILAKIRYDRNYTLCQK